MKRLLPLLALSGCSVFFNPSRAPEPACPTTPASCPARPNSTASCADTACVYACEPTFFDADGIAETGCEVSCTSTPIAPPLEALVGEKSGEIRWLWADGENGSGGARLCTGAALGNYPTCVDVPATACREGRCEHVTTGTDNVRVYARLQRRDHCGNLSLETSATTQSVTPINGAFATANGLTVESACNGTATAQGDGSIRLTNPSNLYCLTAATFGDDNWHNFTMRAQVRLSTGNGLLGGLAMRYPSGMKKPRLAALLAASSSDSETGVALYRRPPDTDANDTPVGSSIRDIPTSQWVELQVVAKDGVVSISTGPEGGALTEALRWSDPNTAQQDRGRFALFIINLGLQTPSIDFRRFTASTIAELPTPGATSVSYRFNQSALPSSIRAVPVGTANVKVASCPTLAAPATCAADAGCVPRAGSGCLDLNQMGNVSATFDQPVGIDTRLPWHLHYTFAFENASNLAQLLRTPFGVALKGPPAAMPNGPLQVFGTAGVFSLTPQTWHRVELDVEGSRYSLRIDGQSLANEQLLPAPFGPHLGAFTLGGQDAFMQTGLRAYWTDIEVSQP